MGSKSKSQGGSLLLAIRKALGLTQSEFATLIGCSDTVVSRRERGLHEPSLKPGEIVAADKAMRAKGLRWCDFESEFESPSAGETAEGD